MNESVLKALREQLGLSQNGLAAESGVPQGAISGYERNERDLTPGVAVKLAAALKRDPLQLYLEHNLAACKQGLESGDSSPKRALKLAQELVKLLEAGYLDKDQTRMARSYINQLFELVEGSPLMADTVIKSAGRGSTGSSFLHAAMPKYLDINGGAGLAAMKNAGETDHAGASIYEDLGRDSFGRKVAKNAGESDEAGASIYEQLHRDSFGRKK